MGNSMMAGTEMMRIADMRVIEVRVDVGENDIPKVSIGDTALIEVDAYNNTVTLTEANLPLRVEALSSIWTVTYQLPSRYHWLLQFYLREAGLALSWVGTGRFIFSLNFSDADMAEVTRRVVAACQHMQADGWWWQGPGSQPKAIRRKLLKEMLQMSFSGRRW